MTRMRRAMAGATRFLLGPWQPRLSFVFVFVLLAFASQASVGQLIARPNPAADVPIGSAADVLLVVPLAALRAVILTLLLAAVTAIARRVTRRASLTRAAYLTSVVVVSIVVAGGAFARYAIDPRDEPGAFAAFVVRTIVLVLVVLATLGTIEERFARKATQAEAAASLIAAQRTSVIDAEERARKSIASYLHDRVQADIVTASLRLLQVRPLAPPEVAERIDHVTADLEAIRAHGLRSASQRLSPDMAHVGLSGALDALAQSYAPAMDVLVRVRVDGAAWHALPVDRSQAQLGIYRIVEQAVLNAAVHGRAAHVTVEIDQHGEHIVAVIADDGSGIDPNPQPGTGHAVIDAWVGILGGTWSRSPNTPGGTRVTVLVPLVLFPDD